MVCLGLGNPGREYLQTRHNVGFWLADILAASLSINLKAAFFKPYALGTGSVFDGHVLTLVKPQTFMNRSGEIFSANPNLLPANDKLVMVFCDQMDLPAGTLRLKNRGGTAGHNGLKSISQAIGANFLPLYIGIGRPEIGEDVISHVLGQPSAADQALIEAALDRVLPGLDILFHHGIEPAMSFLNQRPANVATNIREP